MTDDVTASLGDVDVKLFGDPRSADVYRGPERRSAATPAASTPSGGASTALPRHTEVPSVGLGRGDGFATFLFVLGTLVLLVTVVVGTLILYNARNVGAFSNPWDSTRVAIGLAVLAVGITQSALLIGLSRVTTYLVVLLRLRARDHDAHRHD